MLILTARVFLLLFFAVVIAPHVPLISGGESP